MKFVDLRQRAFENLESVHGKASRRDAQLAPALYRPEKVVA
ncbi:MAG: hypothetical protein ACI4NV_07405 [Thermoguttaceae bacterium]